ncbi:MAG: hypothetical protein QM642_06885 [Edaphocola sp.]
MAFKVIDSIFFLNKITYTILKNLTPLLFVAFSCSVISCQKSNDVASQAENQQHSTMSSYADSSSILYSELITIGNRHNASLDYVLPYLPVRDSSNYYEGVDIIKESLTDEYQNEQDWDSAVQLAVACSTEVAKNIQLGILEQGVANSDCGDAYNQIKAAILNETYSSSDFQSAVLAICESQIALHPTSAQRIKNMGGIAIGSYLYWTDETNFDNWMNKVNPPASLEMGKWEKGLRFVCADFIGSTAGPAMAVFASGFEAWGWD